MLWKNWPLFYTIVLTKVASINIFLPMVVNGNQEDDPLVVNTQNGTIKGFFKNSTLGKKARAFYGIPYAEPPVGPLRFQKPLSKKPWNGTFNATIKANSCVQIVDETYDNFSGSVMWNANTNMSEDCLRLNVWAPEHKQTNLSVLVWIYGGGFYSGTSTLDVYDATTLVSEENVIVVSMNYRVASLGFLSFGDKLVPGNAGLYDQQLALKWIKENIRAFGGDVNRITVFGESAGAVSVGFHLLSPTSRSFFTRAILQSGYITAPWGFHDNATARKSAEALAKALNCSTALNNDTLQCLLEKDAEHIVNNETWGGGVVDFPFVPVQDGVLIPNSTQNMSDAWTVGKDTTVLLGSNANEGSYFLEYFLRLPATEGPKNVTEENFTAVIKALNPVFGEPPMNKVLEVYGNVTPSSTEGRLSVLDEIVGDYHFTCPVVQLAELLSKANASVYQYYFARRSLRNPWPMWMGVIHGEEIGFEFGQPLNETEQYYDVDKNVSRITMRYWANFAKTGDPNCGEPEQNNSFVPYWPQRETKERKYLVLNANITVRRGYQIYQCKFWENLRYNWTPPTEDTRNPMQAPQSC